MHERGLLLLSLALNAALAAACGMYAFVPRRPEAAGPAKVREERPRAPVWSRDRASEGVALAGSFGWEEVESEEYAGYLERLRRAGCPEARRRMIVEADVEQLAAERRLAIALAHDVEWWRTEPEMRVLPVLQSLARTVEERRLEELSRWLGPQVAAARAEEVPYWQTLPLTGPVLGRLTPRAHGAVQEICAGAVERQQAYYGSLAMGGGAPNGVHLARLREETRAQLRGVLGEVELEELLVRYSATARRLRQELERFQPSPDEFRRIFDAVDLLDRRVELEFGGLEAMSPAQRERWQGQKEWAIRQALTAERYRDYLLSTAQPRPSQ